MAGDRENEKIDSDSDDYPVAEKKSLSGFVGFANLPNQVHRRSVKQGFEFNLMVVGESGLGKSTLINSLFLTELYEDRDYPSAAERIEATVEIMSTSVEIEEKGVRLKLSIVDTPGYGDSINNEDSWAPIVSYIDEQFEEYLNGESKVNRSRVTDTRIHCVLYFIAPSGHGLKMIDVECMKQLQTRANIVPILAKADSLTQDECVAFKRKVMLDIEDYGIEIFKFSLDSDEDEENLEENRKLEQSFPLAVIGSNAVIDSSGRRVRARVYPWGVVEIENEEHCDFVKLRNMLIRTHMQDFKDSTHDVHYENYRTRKLSEIAALELNVEINPLTKFESERRDHEKRLREKEEEMKKVFEFKVAEKERKLKESEAELKRQHEEMQMKLQKQRLEFEKKKSDFEEEKRLSLDKKKKGSFGI
eukprot:Sdes_comp9082_c0_seq1m535